jgi:tRNA-specific 2-thiouridylase
VRLRYRHKAIPAAVAVNEEDESVKVKFDKPQSAVTPGQAAVFYDNDEVLGGGFIEGPLPASQFAAVASEAH